MKVIFLDIDGVLNKNNTYMKSGLFMEPELVKRFNELLEELSDVKIVISSSWRDDMDDLQSQLQLNGFKYWNRVIGKTHKENLYRGEQILAYLKYHKNIENYLVVDDSMIDIHGEKDEFKFIKKEFCLEINANIGLSKINCKYIKNYFLFL